MADNNRIRIGDHVTIYQRGRKMTWCADYWLDGVHRRQSLKTANKKIAFKRALRLDAEIAAGTHRKPPPPITVAQAAKDYVKYLETEHRAPRTLVKYRGILTVLENFLADQGVTRLSQLTLLLFDRFRWQRKANHHRKTLYTEGVVVKQFLRWAKSRNLIAENPIADCRLDKPPLESKEGPSLVQVERVLGALDEPTRTQIAVLAFTGMRAGELQHLQMHDLDLDANWLHIRSRLELPTKTGQSRKMPIHVRLRPMLASLPRRPRPWLFAMSPTQKFADGNRAISIKKLNETFQEVASKVGLPTGRKKGGFTLHSLRHFFETFTVNAGIPQRVVDTWLGHGSDRSMAAVYYKLADDDSQLFMTKVPFGTGVPAADAGDKECAR